MKKYICEKCGKELNTNKGLGLHNTRMHPWVPPPPPPKPAERHVNYADLVRNSTRSWGMQMNKNQEKHPQLDELKLGALLEILATLQEIRKHFS
jgi:hypothetical protein